MACYTRGLAMLATLLLPAISFAHWWRPDTERAAFYVAPAVYVEPPLVVSAYMPVEVPFVEPAPTTCLTLQEPVYAAPQAVPPSSMPPAPAGAGVRESRSPHSSEASSADRVTANFWNLSGRSLWLQVDGRAQSLEPGQHLQLSLPRQFVWQADNRTPETERVPSSTSSVYLILRP
jgi:hypothetical protein